MSGTPITKRLPVAAIALSVIVMHSLRAGPVPLAIDPSDSGATFEGIGALSAGASTRLLIDYPEAQRAEVLDYLFRPGFGAALPHLKVEIGGEVNSTCGTEPSHMRTRDDENFHRGYEWWLMKEAKSRRPDILLDTLAWGAPGWIGNGNYYTQDMADYVAGFIKGAKSAHGLDIHYTGIWNERMYDAEWIKLLRRTLDANELANVRIVAADLHGTLGDVWQLAGKLPGDLKLSAAIDVLGAHYPKFHATAAAKTSGKPLWSSEDGPWRGDWEGAKKIAEMLNRNYVQGRMTKTITWSLVSSYYDALRLPDSGMMLAREPWSGHYEVQPALWVFAHHNQFAKPGWKYLDKSCTLLPGGGSVVCLASPDGKEVSVVVETMGAKAAQSVEFQLAEALGSRPWHLWKTSEAEHFVRMPDLPLVDGKLTLTLEPDSIQTITTTTGQAKGTTHPPESSPFPMPYSDDFEKYRPGHTPRYFSDQVGTFEVVDRADGKGNALAQVLPAPGITWEPQGDKFGPFTVIGDSKGKDYRISADVLAADGVTVGMIGRYGPILVNESSTIAKGYRFEITAGSGAWKLSTPKKVLAEGRVIFPGGIWRELQLEMSGPVIACRLDGKILAKITDGSHAEGLAGLAAGYAGAQFDHISLTPSSPPENHEQHAPSK